MRVVVPSAERLPAPRAAAASDDTSWAAATVVDRPGELADNDAAAAVDRLLAFLDARAAGPRGRRRLERSYRKGGVEQMLRRCVREGVLAAPDGSVVAFWFARMFELLGADAAPELRRRLGRAFLDGDATRVFRLFAEGADARADVENGDSMLYYAVLLGSAELAAALVDKGADVNATDEQGETLLHCASWVAGYKGSTAVVEVFLDKGADVHAKDEDGRTPLHRASGFRALVALVELLLEHGADADAKDRDGRTPLHRAIECHAPVAVIDALLKSGADIDAKDKNRKTPLDDARRAAGPWQRGAVIELIEDAAAVRDDPNRGTSTPE